VRLFVERAQEVHPGFSLDAENARAIAQICQRLDGLPLAIELAAARIKLLSPSAMLARLESSLSLLTGGARDLPTRQQTLRGTVEWSYKLLGSAEQMLVRRLAVFIGGCTLEAVEAVCDTKGDLGLDILDGMASVADKSLVQQVQEAGAEARFTMLSTIREYAREQLAAAGEEPAVRRAHAAYFLVLAEEGSELVVSDPAWLARFDAEHRNFLAAIDYLVATGESDWGLRLGAALFRFWETREHLAEGRAQLARLLAVPGSQAGTKLRARLLFSSAVLAGEQGDYGSAQKLLEQSLAVCRALGDTRGVAVALNALAVNARDRGELSMAAELFEQCVGIWRELGAPVDVARALSNLASASKLLGDYARAGTLYQECLATFRAIGDEAGAAWTLNYTGDMAREQRDFAAARSAYEQALAAFRELHDGWGRASVLCDLASLDCDQQDFAGAQRLFGESIRIFQELGHKRGIARVLESLAISAVAQGKAPEALRLAGAAAALRERVGAPLTPAQNSALESALKPAHAALEGALGTSAWMEGYSLPLAKVVEEVVGKEVAQGLSTPRPA
ncbi:MAG TPA: tetratricopeptide repeat protein, partial [Terriglobales bacterium]|nr:tetratricopeptide repeat protein [Terriglobales bacterium]